MEKASAITVVAQQKRGFDSWLRYHPPVVKCSSNRRTEFYLAPRVCAGGVRKLGSGYDAFCYGVYTHPLLLSRNPFVSFHLVANVYIDDYTVPIFRY